jgi:hypothetical protein
MTSLGAGGIGIKVFDSDTLLYITSVRGSDKKEHVCKRVEQRLGQGKDNGWS